MSEQTCFETVWYLWFLAHKRKRSLLLDLIIQGKHTNDYYKDIKLKVFPHRLGKSWIIEAEATLVTSLNKCESWRQREQVKWEFTMLCCVRIIMLCSSNVLPCDQSYFGSFLHSFRLHLRYEWFKKNAITDYSFRTIPFENIERLKLICPSKLTNSECIGHVTWE